MFIFCFACLRPVSCVPIVTMVSKLFIQFFLTFILPGSVLLVSLVFRVVVVVVVVVVLSSSCVLCIQCYQFF